MTDLYRRDSFTWLAFLMMALYAYFLNMFGPIAPFLKDELKLSYTVSSLHFSAFAVGILVIGLAGDRLIKQLGRRLSLWIGALGFSGGAVALLLGRNPILTIGAAFLMGLIGSLILSIVPSALADRHGENRAIALSEANVIGSLAGAAGPLLVGWFALTRLGWRAALAIGACAPILMAVGFIKVKTPPSAIQNVGGGKQVLPARYWIFWLAILLAVAIEFCMVSWSADYLATGLNMPKVAAAQSVSLFLAAMIIGRLAGSRLVQRFSPRVLVSGSLSIALTGFSIYYLAASALMGAVGLFITGLGVASLYPLILSMAIESAGELTIQASSRATLASGLAILSLPLTLGRLADAEGIRLAYGVVFLLIVGTFVVFQLAVGVRDQASWIRKNL